MCVAAFSLALNIGYMMMGSLNGYVMKEYMGMWTEVESEKRAKPTATCLPCP